jgi:hypothetical protein
MALLPCECVQASPPWNQLPDIIAAVQTIGGVENPDKSCYEGMSISEQMSAWYCALLELVE